MKPERAIALLRTMPPGAVLKAWDADAENYEPVTGLLWDSGEILMQTDEKEGEEAEAPPASSSRVVDEADLATALSAVAALLVVVDELGRGTLSDELESAVAAIENRSDDLAKKCSVEALLKAERRSKKP